MSNKPDIIERLEGFPYGREMQDNLIALTVALTAKKTPPTDYTFRLHDRSGIFVDHADLDQMLDVASSHLRDEFLSPDELETKMIASYHPGIPKAAYAIATQYAERPRDQLTGFHQKDQVPRIMGFATLHAQASGNPVTVTEIDFSNMRGTNEHFEKVLACVMNSRITPEIKQEAMKMTDQVAHIVAAIMHATYQEELQIETNGKASTINARTGGDEARMVANADPALCDAIYKIALSRYEQATALMGLHDHTHLKRPLDPWSNGFGAAGAVFPLQADGRFEDHVKNADAEIQNRKIEIGQNRLIDEMLQRLKPSFCNDPELYTNPQKAAVYLKAVLDNINALQETLGEPEQQSRVSTELDNFAASRRSGHLLTVEEIHHHFKTHLANDLAKAGINLTPEQLKAISIKTTRFPAIDYATNTILATDMPAMAGAALQSIASINKKAGIEADPWVMGISLHNIAGLNNNLGHENASAVMHYVVNEIIRPALHNYGIADENFLIGHMGGGEFRIIIQPVIPDGKKDPRVIGQKTIDTIINDIETDIGQVNFMPVDFALDPQRTSTNGMTPRDEFHAIQNPRPEVSPREDGLIATVVASRYKPKIDQENNRGGAAVHFIGELLAEEVKVRRGEVDRRQSGNLSHSGFPQTRDDTTNFTLF